ncbi:MAG TPA: D-alanyl-D-alanine carboxypeptidase family protein [Xanthobacteraceae bacterium]|nr:D-alanyl-D-alanine carboxypeptidase family protein [Xanthobacteraceae bacterium]
MSALVGKCAWAQRGFVTLAVAGFVASAAAAPSAIGLVGSKKDDFQTTAPHAILVDFDSGTVLFEKGADVPTPPSSMAKLMTVEVVFNELKRGRIKLDDEYLVSEDAWRRGGAPSHTSSMFAPIHSRVRVEDLLRGAIIMSGNDACITLAEGIAGNEPAFVGMMNNRARELRLTKSYFTNSTGLPDPAQKMTVRELARLARHIIRTYPNFYGIYGEHEFTWNKIRQQNRNPLLTLNIGADGLKTGYTQDGGYGLVGSAMQNGMRLIVVVNGLRTAKERADEAKKILEFGYRGFESKPLFAASQVVGYAKLFGGASGSVALVGEGPISVLMPKNATERVSAKIVYSGPVPAPVRQGQPIGNLNVYRGERVVAEVPLFAAEGVGRGSLPQRAFDAASELVIGLFRTGSKKI